MFLTKHVKKKNPFSTSMVENGFYKYIGP